MKTQKLLALTLSMLFILSIVAVPVCAAVAPSLSPLWENTFQVWLAHQRIDGYACCSVIIEGFTGTDKIDNVNITLSLVTGANLVEIASWEGLSAIGDTFEFYDEIPNVPGGQVYRLNVTADVHKDGYVESLDQYSDIRYNL